MVIVVITLTLATHYSPGIMAEVIANRQAGSAWASLPAHLPAVDGYIAARDCNMFGHIVHIRPPAGPWERHLVVDCARPPGTDGTIERMTADGRLFELSYETAQRWQTVGQWTQLEIGIAIPRGLIP